VSIGATRWSSGSARSPRRFECSEKDLLLMHDAARTPNRSSREAMARVGVLELRTAPLLWEFEGEDLET
jgi:hypothetical protein